MTDRHSQTAGLAWDATCTGLSTSTFRRNSLQILCRCRDGRSPMQVLIVERGHAAALAVSFFSRPGATIGANAASA
jgi:hypothetical protein